MQNGNLKNIVTLHLRAFPVVACDERTDETHALMVPVTKQQLQAAQIVGQSSKELIERLCSRQGFTVIEIGTPDKCTVNLDLNLLLKQDEQAAGLD